MLTDLLTGLLTFAEGMLTYLTQMLTDLLMFSAVHLLTFLLTYRVRVDKR